MSSTLISRYGEPFYSERPVVKEDGTWPLALSESDKCYKELELERRHINIKTDQTVSLVFRNPLAVLAGSDSTVEIVIQSTSWHLHKALLSSRSSLFKSLLQHDPPHINLLTKESSVEVKPAIFTLFVQWLYTSDFDPLSPLDALNAEFLGKAFGANAFSNKAIDKLYALNLERCTFTSTDVRMIFSDINVGPGARRLAVDSIALGFLTQELDLEAEEWKKALGQNDGWSEVIKAMARQHLQGWKSKTQGEYYDVV